MLLNRIKELSNVLFQFLCSFKEKLATSFFSEKFKILWIFWTLEISSGEVPCYKWIQGITVVTDPRFARRGLVINREGRGAYLLFGSSILKNCVKLKEVAPRGWLASLVSCLIRQCRGKMCLWVVSFTIAFSSCSADWSLVTFQFS